MSKLEFKKAARPMGISVRWEEDGDDSKSVFLGEVVQGDYIEKKEGVGPNESNIYVVKLDDGREVSVWGTTLLDDCFEKGNEGEEIPVGAVVRITCLGKKQGKTGPSKQPGKGYWTFEVEFAIPSPAFKAAHKKEGGAALAASGKKAEPVEEDADEAEGEDEYS